MERLPIRNTAMLAAGAAMLESALPNVWDAISVANVRQDIHRSRTHRGRGGGRPDMSMVRWARRARLDAIDPDASRQQRRRLARLSRKWGVA